MSGRPSRLPSFVSVSSSSASRHDSIAAALSLKISTPNLQIPQQLNNQKKKLYPTTTHHYITPTQPQTQSKPNPQKKTKKQKNASSSLPNLPQSQRSPRLQTRRTTLSHFLLLRNQQTSPRRRFEEYFHFRRSFSSSLSVEGVIGRETTSKSRCGYGGEGDGEVLCFLIWGMEEERGKRKEERGWRWMGWDRMG